jgi:hypothetical protein
VQDLKGFLALRETAPCPPLHALADACVTGLDGFRAPPEPAELERRRRAPLSPAHEAMLAQWGYPYVLSQFRFHLSLTGSLKDLSDLARARLLEAAQQHFQGLASCRIDRLSLFIEPERGAPFRLFEQVEFSK